MRGREFTSVFATDLTDYIAFKASMGFTGTSRVWYLHRFDMYCSREQATVCDRATVEGWVTEQLGRSGSYRSWMSYIRDFGRWLALHRDPGAYVLSDVWKARYLPPTPFLFRQEHIDRFFAAAMQLRTNSPWEWQSVAFFTLMHCCGLRTGETRNLLREQVDLHDGYVTILDSKAHRSRRLPLTPEVVKVLSDCDAITQTHLPDRHTFFVSRTGAPVTTATVGVMFNRIWDQASLPRPVGGAKPRPYDFRQHFAYANLERWLAEGTDTAAMLPYLQTYMGHASIDSTYYYVHTSPDFMDAYANITQETSWALLPEVGFA